MENRQTKKQLFFEIFRFLLVGGFATVLDYVTAYLLTLSLKRYIIYECIFIKCHNSEK